ncbi:hypothetical protein B0O99DRAFT_688030 [Bisporella sp. PMI_857]|nr:hypothetical protein B0O99DRAFT_688030 [Bisporella sp. PMI_857]
MKGTTFLLLLASVASAADVKHLKFPGQLASGIRPKDSSFISYSIEFADFSEFTGNLTHPNKLSARLLQNLADIAGSYPHIRVGGTTANHAAYDPNQEEAIILNYTTPGADQPSSLTWGPAWLELFHYWPTQYTVGITFDSGEKGEQKTVAEAAAITKALRSSLYALEVGNEFDVFPVDRQNQTWNIATYVDQWLDRTAAVGTQSLGEVQERKTGPIFQAGVFVVPGLINNDTSWTPQNALELGIASTGRVKTFCEHQYFGAACTPVKPTLAGSILNHTLLASYMHFHEMMSTYTLAQGIPYVIGETNSIACQGLAGVSDVFGSALWAADYALYAASLNISKMFFHTGVGYRYAAWQPIQNGTTLPGPRPLYYSHLLIAEALAGGHKQVQVLANETSFSAYGIYTQASPWQKERLSQIVILNLAIYNATTGESRPSVQVGLPSISGYRRVLRRLTAPDVVARQGITWAGRTVQDDGSLKGNEIFERFRGDKVEVFASEAVVVSYERGY